ncbi:hypothetical protein BHE74_00046949 [Ensete ventricosum]|nr:hypothetical protein BHE74_00046949 [Ensete ventricosum]
MGVTDKIVHDGVGHRTLDDTPVGASTSLHITFRRTPSPSSSGGRDRRGCAEDVGRGVLTLEIAHVKLLTKDPTERSLLGKELGDIGHRQREQPQKEVRQKLDGELARHGGPPRPGLHEEALL